MAEKQASVENVAKKDENKNPKNFWEKNSKLIIIASSIIIILGGAYWGYKYFYKIPKENKASVLIFPAEKLFSQMAATSSFNKDSVSIVLNGGYTDGTKVTGLLKIASSYSGTAAANRAEYIIGACYLHLKEFDKAIKHLKEFDGNGASQIQSKAYIMLGHAYAEKKKTDDALNYYRKAADVAEKDEGMASEALYMAGMYADAMGKTKEAIELFQKIKDNYEASQRVQSGDVEKYLAKLGVTK